MSMKTVTNTFKTPADAVADIGEISDRIEQRRAAGNFPSPGGTSERLDSYVDSIEKELEGERGIGDIYSNEAIASVYQETQRGRARIAGEEEQLLEQWRFNRLQALSLLVPPNVAGLPLLDYKIEPYMKNGRIVFNKDNKPLYILKAKYGFRFFERKNYKINMYNVLAEIYNRARSQGFHLGNFKRNEINPSNAMVYEDDLQIRALTALRNTGDYYYNSFHGMETVPQYMSAAKRFVLGAYEFLKGLIFGPRLDVLVGPTTEERVLGIEAAMSGEGAKKRLEEVLYA